MPQPLPPARTGHRPTRSNLLAAGAVLLLASVTLTGVQLLSLRASLVDDLRTQARIIGTNSSAALMYGDARAGEETLRALASSRSVTGAAIFDGTLHALARYRTQGAAPLNAPPEPLLERGYGFEWRQVEVIEPVQMNGQRIGHVAVRASLDTLWAHLAVFASVTAGVTLLSLILAWLLGASVLGTARAAAPRH